MAEVSSMSGVRYLTVAEAAARGYPFSVNDQVTAWGHWIGRVEYLLADGYVGVRGADGRLDEYRAVDLRRM